MSNLKHFCCDTSDIGRYAILTQAPSHAAEIASLLDAHRVPAEGLYHIYTGSFSGASVSVIACGIGSPAAALALEELALCGTTTVLRVGTARPIGENSADGDIVLATGGVKMDGTSAEYVVMEFPALSSFPVTRVLAEEAEDMFGPRGFRMGIVEGRDVYSRRRDFDRTLVSGSCIYEKALGRGGALCSDMETAAVLVVARYLGMRASSIDLVCSDCGENTPAKLADCNRLAVRTIARLIRQDAEDDGLCLLS